MSNPIFETDKYKNAVLKTYTSISALSSATGLDKKILKLARKKDFEGCYANGTVAWNRLKPVLEARYNELTDALPDDIATLKQELVKRDIKLKDLEIKKREGNYLEPEDIKQFLVSLATKLSVSIKKELGELPPRLAGKDEASIQIEITKTLSNIFEVIQEIDVHNITSNE